jgi:RND family efflux transporter MFP subunit
MNIEPGFSRGDAELADMADAEARQRRNRLILKGVVIAAAVLVLLIVALRYLRRETPTAESAPRVTVFVPGRQEVTRTVSATGTLAARREMPVGVAGEGGMIARVFVEPGDWVRAGQTLALIDASVQVQQASQLRAQVAAARANAALAEAELARAQALVGRGFISKADVDRKTATRDAARAQVAVAQAQLGEVNARIGRLAIRAPAAGLVLTRSVEPGQVVSPGDGALFRVAKDGEMELKAKMSDTDLTLLSVGDPVDVTPVGSRSRFVGHIWQLSPVVDPVSRQGEARVQLAYDKALRPGSFASAEIRSGTTRVPLLPESAVLSDERGNFVYIVGPDDKVARRDVKVGTVSDTGLPILSGLEGTEKVVFSAGAFLGPEDAVIPVLQKKRP